ncbi:MAG TPA: transporter [Geobacteraceae bacterium]|nr:transporter [Geobacteraceae bacterium]
MRTCLTSIAVLITFGLFTSCCYAETSTDQSNQNELKQLRKIVDQQGKLLQEQSRQLEVLRQKLGVSEDSLDIRGKGQGDTGQAQNQQPASENEKKGAKKQPIQAQEQLPSQPVGRPPEKPPITSQYKEIEAIFRQQGVLTPRNTLVVEPSFQYAFTSSNQVVLNGYTIIPAITIGLINTQRVEQNTYMPALSLRYGLLDRLEANVYVPYVFRDSSTAFTAQNVTPGSSTVFDANGRGIGDVQFGLRYQINNPTGNWPILIGGLLAKSDTGRDPFSVLTDPTTGLQQKLPTGTGFWGIQPSLSFIYPSDPVVFFGSASYLYNFSANHPLNGVVSEIDPGGIFGFNFGVGFSLNERISLSLGYEHYVVFPTKVNNSYIGLPASATQNTTLGSLVFGASYRVNERLNVNFSLEAGITSDAPAVVLTMRLPFSI